MNKINSLQLAVTFIITRLSAEMLLIPGELIKYGPNRFYAILFAKVIVLLLYLPAVFITLRFKGDNFITATMRRSPLLAGFLGLLFTMGITCIIADTVINLQLYITDTLLHSLLLITGVIMIIFAGFYGAYKGVSAVSRTSVFALCFFILLIVLIIITMMPDMDMVYLYPSFIEDGEYFIQSMTAEVSCNSELLMFAVLCANVRQKPNKTLYYLLAVFVLLEVINLIYNLVLGPFLDALEYPLYVISSLSDIVIFQRLDGIDAIVWLFASIIKISMLLVCVKQIYSTVTKKSGSTMFLAVFSLFCFGLCMIIGNDRIIYNSFQKFMNTALPIVFSGAVIPLIALIAGKKRKEKKDE